MYERSGELYFARVMGRAAAEALKSVYGATPYEGATFWVKKGEKASFDPTPGRKWHVTEMDFSLKRGPTPEVEDGTPSQLDDDFDEYFLSTNGKFAPWDFSKVHSVHVGGNWTRVLPKKEIVPPFS